MFQFMAAGAGSGVAGKKENTKNTARKSSAAMLIARPHDPKLNGQGSSGAPDHLRQSMLPMEHMYVDREAFVVRDTTELRATEDPMLISDSSAEDTNVMMIEFKGSSRLGETLDSQELNGSPSSRANANSWREAVATTVMLEKVTRIDTSKVSSVFFPRNLETIAYDYILPKSMRNRPFWI